MMSTLYSRPQAIAASMSSVVGLNPPRSFTGFGSFGRGEEIAQIHVWPVIGRLIVQKAE